MTRALSALTATVTTATVTIKTLTIDRRQVTLATFRQVPELDIFGSDLRLRGIPWGFVNYCPGKNGCEAAARPFLSPHAHLLWQLDDALYRCAVYESAFDVRPVLAGDVLRHLYRAAVDELSDLDQLYIAT